MSVYPANHTHTHTHVIIHRFSSARVNPRQQQANLFVVYLLNKTVENPTRGDLRKEPAVPHILPAGSVGGAIPTRAGISTTSVFAMAHRLCRGLAD